MTAPNWVDIAGFWVGTIGTAATLIVAVAALVIAIGASRLQKAASEEELGAAERDRRRAFAAEYRAWWADVMTAIETNPEARRHPDLERRERVLKNQTWDFGPALTLFGMVPYLAYETLWFTPAPAKLASARHSEARIEQALRAWVADPKTCFPAIKAALDEALETNGTASRSNTP